MAGVGGDGVGGAGAGWKAARTRFPFNERYRDEGPIRALPVAALPARGTRLPDDTPCTARHSSS